MIWAVTHFRGFSDSKLLNCAEEEGRILLTLDRDFLQIAAQRRHPLERSGVIVFRVHPANPERLEKLVRQALARELEWAGQVVLVTPQGIEVVPRLK